MVSNTYSDAQLDSVVVEVNDLEKMNYSHDKYLTTDLGRIVPIFQTSLEPGEKIHLSFDTLTKFQPLVSDMYQDFDVSIHTFAVTARHLWKDYPDFRFPSYKEVKNGVSATTIPYFNLADSTRLRPNILDCVELADEGFRLSTYQLGYAIKNASVSGGTNFLSVMEDPDGSYKGTNSDSTYFGIKKIFNSLDSSNCYLSDYSYGKGTLADTMDGYWSRPAEDLGHQILHKDPQNPDLYKNYIDISTADNISDDNFYLRLFYCRNLTLDKTMSTDYLGYDASTVHPFAMVMYSSARYYLLGFYIPADPSTANDILNRLKPNWIKSKDYNGKLLNSQWRVVNKCVKMSNITSSTSPYASDTEVMAMSWYDFITSRSNAQINVNDPFSSAYVGIIANYLTWDSTNKTYVPGPTSADRTLNLVCGIPCSSDSYTAQSEDCVKIGVVRGFLNSAVTDNNSDEVRIDALPFRAYWSVINRYYTDLNYSEDFDFENTLFKYGGNELNNLQTFFSDFSTANGPDGSTANWQYYEHPNFGYVCDSPLVSSTNYYKWLLSRYFYPTYRCYEEDFFTMIKPECDPSKLAVVPVAFNSMSNFSATTAVNVKEFGNGTVTALGSRSGHIEVTTPGLNVSGSTRNATSSNSFFSNLGFTLDSLRTEIRANETMYAILNAGNHTDEQQLAIFGVKPSDARLNLPTYLGGSCDRVSVGEIFNTNITDDQYLGQTAGKASLFAKTDNINYDADEKTYIISLMSIRPRNLYASDGISASLQRISYDEQFNPKFADLGEVDVYGRELNYQPYQLRNILGDNISEKSNLDTIGYLPRYTDLKGCPNRVCGDFRDTMDSYLCVRKMLPFETAVIDADFMQIHPHQYDNIFAINDGTDRIYCNVHVNCNVARALSINPTLKL